MQFIPSTSKQKTEMTNAIGIDSVEKLFDIVPDNIRLRNKLGLQESISEMELEIEAKKISGMSKSASEYLCFLGSGVYDHYIPKTVDFLSNRSEFYTAYTPYQAEVSQGTLQVLYEFQTMICELSGLDVANASLYDGASALAEACSIALASRRNSKILISETVNPRYVKVAKTYLQNRDVKIIMLPTVKGKTDFSIIDKHQEEIAGIVIQSPNHFGLLEDWAEVKSQLVDPKSLLIAVSDPMSLSIIKPPGDCGADIFVGEGQALGNPMSYGGPFLGLMALTSKLKRKMPGRIIGKTVDLDGNDGYVLTLQTREQHIRREKATSNICTNQGLIALRSAIYMSLLGKEKLPELAKFCFDKAQYTANEIAKLTGFSIPLGNQFIKEFVVNTPSSASAIVKFAENNSVLIGIVENDQTDRLIQIAVTEKRSKADIDKLILILKDYVEN